LKTSIANGENNGYPEALEISPGRHVEPHLPIQMQDNPQGKTMQNISERQNHTVASKHWPNPYESSAVYVPLAELVKAYQFLNQLRPANAGGEVLVTEELLISDWTHDGLLWVDAYIVPQGNEFAAGVRYGEGSAVHTPAFRSELLQVLYNKYCPQVQSGCNTATARLKWHWNTKAGFKQELRFDVEHDRTVVEFDAAEMMALLFRTNPSYAERLVAQAKKANGLA
jgi:hypothetical protein